MHKGTITCSVLVLDTQKLLFLHAFSLDKKFLKKRETAGTEVITTSKTVNLWNCHVSNQKRVSRR